MKDQRILRLIVNNESRSLLPLDRHVIELEFSLRKGLDLPSPHLGDFSIPHSHGFSTDAESIGDSLVRATKVLDNFRESHHVEKSAGQGIQASVSMLPSSVKPLTRARKDRFGNLAYMASKQRVPKDEWTVRRGAKMRVARDNLGKTQTEIAGLVGCTREYVSQCESGITGLTPDDIQRVWSRFLLGAGLEFPHTFVHPEIYTSGQLDL